MCILLGMEEEWGYACFGFWERDALWMLSEILCTASGVDTAVKKHKKGVCMCVCVCVRVCVCVCTSIIWQ